MDQGVGPEFKSQYCKKKKQNKTLKIHEHVFKITFI
jgi:hypothetical protein